MVQAILARVEHSVARTSRTTIGVPIGTVRLPPQHVYSFLLLLKSVFCKQRVYFRGVDKEDKDAFTLHLQPLVAASLDDNHPALVRFLQVHSGEYHPGVRRRCPTWNLTKARHTDNARFTFVELFAGIGGFRLGLERIGGRCVLANELDEDAAAVYRTNFPDSRLAVGDVVDMDSENLPPFDCLVGGFPCQTFSKRGDQRGLADDRGQLYRELARILQDCKPKCFLFENVPGLVTLDGGHRTASNKGEMPQFETGAVFDRILDTFRACDYQVHWQVLNSRKWLPQMRERVYIVGTRNDLNCPPFDWDGLLLKDLDDEIASTVRQVLEPKDSPAVLASALTEQQFSKLRMGFSKRGKPLRECMMDLDAKAPTIISRYHSPNSAGTKYLMEEADGAIRELPRFLTPRECTRLMGFPEDFIIPTDDKQAVAEYYQAIGNAVCPIVISSIAEVLIQSIKAKTISDPECQGDVTLLET